MILIAEEYEAISFSNVNEFMLQDKHDQADLFLLDIRLPDGNGIIVCEMLKKDNNKSGCVLLKKQPLTKQTKFLLTCLFS